MTTTLLTPNQAGTDGGNGDVFNLPALSADGRYVAFASSASDLIAGDTNGDKDVFLRDVKAAHPVLASLRSPLLPNYNMALLGGILGDTSADGRYVVFASQINNNDARRENQGAFLPAKSHLDLRGLASRSLTREAPEDLALPLVAWVRVGLRSCTQDAIPVSMRGPGKS